MAELTGRNQIFTGNTASIDTTVQYPLGTRAWDTDGNEYIYLTGVASTIVGSWVTYDELGVTTLLVANAVGPVAVAMSINTTYYGWYSISGTVEAALAANCAANASIGFETTSGYAGDGKAAGDTIYGAFSRDATAGSAAVATCQILYPFVDDNSN